MTAEGVRDFATHLAVHRRVSASTQNQATSAVLSLWREVLGVEVENLTLVPRAKRGSRLPTVLSAPETAALLGAMRGTARLMAALIYGGGLRVSECCALRVKDLDFDQGLVIVRGGTGDQDRSTLLAQACQAELRAHLKRVQNLYRAARQSGLAGVWLPDALERKYPKHLAKRPGSSPRNAWCRRVRARRETRREGQALLWRSPPELPTHVSVRARKLGAPRHRRGPRRAECARWGGLTEVASRGRQRLSQRGPATEADSRQGNLAATRELRSRPDANTERNWSSGWQTQYTWTVGLAINSIACP